MNWLDRFLPDQANRSLAPGFFAFLIAALGFVVNAIGWAVGMRWLALVGFILGAVGIGGGFIAVAIGQVRAAREVTRRARRPE